MKLSFLLDEDYLIYHTFCNPERKGSKEIVKFQNFAWRKSPECYSLLSGKEGKVPPDEIGSTVKELPLFIKTLKSSIAYKEILVETKDYLQFCKVQWAKNLQASSKAMKELTGLSFNKRFRVFVTHPSLHNGMNWGNDTISWGHPEEWPNYTTVYLWHEILHSCLVRSDESHAIIQLLTDNELRIRLNGGRYPPFKGHEGLFPLMRKISPSWKQYLKSSDRNILEFQSSISSKL